MFFIRLFSLLFLRKKKKHSLAFLNIAQSLGVLNDNTFKLLVVFWLLAHAEETTPQKASQILSLVGAIYVLPFLLFSHLGGLLADRFSKQKILAWLKVVEIALIGFALVTFSQQNAWTNYLLLFLLATHSALFGPSKYAILPEIVPLNQVSKANGLITSCTYLAMIVGTFLASFMTDLFEHDFQQLVRYCLLFALLGLFSMLQVKTTPPSPSQETSEAFFSWQAMRHTLRLCRLQPRLLLAMGGSAYFLFLGAFIQLNLVPFALDSLHLSETAGGYLFLATAVGIALGSLIRSKNLSLAVGRAHLALLGISLLLLFIPFVKSCMGYLGLLGFLGGIFIVPFESFIQIHSPKGIRGQAIAMGNFFSFCGVLLASVTLYTLSHGLGLSASQGFVCLGLLTLGVGSFFSLSFSDYILQYTAQKILPLFFFIQVSNADLIPSSRLIVLQIDAYRKALFLLFYLPQVHFLIPIGEKRYTLALRLNRLLPHIHLFPLQKRSKGIEELIRKGKLLCEKDQVLCVLWRTDSKVSQEPVRGEKPLFATVRKTARRGLWKRRGREVVFSPSLGEF